MTRRQRAQPMAATETMEVSNVNGQLTPPIGKGLLILPAELLEDILVVLAELDSPTTISALASVCKSFRKLIYSPEDKHLWRRIYLATFDDPRSLSGSSDDYPFDWASEYQGRIRALLVFKRKGLDEIMSPRRYSLRSVSKKTSISITQPTGGQDSSSKPDDDYADVLEALLSLVHTALPVSISTGGEVKKQPWENSSLSTLPARQAAHRAPSYPPHLSALSNTQVSPRAESTSAHTVSIHTVTQSKNIDFLKRVFSYGVLPDIVNLLTTGPERPSSHSPPRSLPTLTSDVGSSATPSSPHHRYSTSELDALNQLIAVFGVSPFLAKPHSSSSNATTTATGGEENAGPHLNEENTLYRHCVALSQKNIRADVLSFVSKRIRIRAQSEVYRMRYLNPRRAYGPFLRVPMENEVGSGDDSSDEDDVDDEDYVPTTAESPTGSVSEHEDEHEEEDEELLIPMPVPHQPKPIPSAEELCADWEHLAAIRIVVQARLEERNDFPEVNGLEHGQRFQHTLLSWENVRAGVWTPGPTLTQVGGIKSDKSSSTMDPKAESSSAQHPSLLKTPSDPPVEWDWAGVEGVWRRAVCWLDYHDLIYHNARGFSLSPLDEATITVPLTLRVTGFSPPATSKYKQFPTIHFDSKRFPTIHVEGRMGGADWAFPGAQEDVRRVKGTVKVCGDGSIWWSMLSSIQGAPEEWEWSSEGIQVGPSLVPGNPVGVRSGCGILGLWTGWQHEPEDPIGAWWQWKVA